MRPGLVFLLGFLSVVGGVVGLLLKVFPRLRRRHWYWMWTTLALTVGLGGFGFIGGSVVVVNAAGQTSSGGSQAAVSPSSESGGEFPLLAQGQVSSEMPVLPGIAPPDVQINMEKMLGFKFGRWVTGAGVLSRCGKLNDADTGAQLTVCFTSATTSNVAYVEANVVGPSVAAANWFFPILATLPFTGNNQQASYDWALANWSKAQTPGQIIERDVGGVTMQLYGSGGTTVFFDIMPEGLEEWLAAHP